MFFHRKTEASLQDTSAFQHHDDINHAMAKLEANEIFHSRISR
jgi:hypothetical protein